MNLQQLIQQTEQELSNHSHQDNSFESCIKCTACTVVCPVSKHNPLYPGPKQSGPDGERLRLKNANYYDEALKYCTNCKRCEVACPSNVKIGDIIVRARNKHARIQDKKFTHIIRDAILSNTDIMGTLATPFAPIVNTITHFKITKVFLDKTLNIAPQRTFPKYSFGTFRQWFKKIESSQRQFPEQVGYFHGCYVNYNNPKLGQAVVEVFNAMNIGITLLEKEKCCGVPLMVNGFPEKAKKQGHNNLISLEKAVQQKKLDIIGTSSTCTLTLRDEYPHILGLDNHSVRDHIQFVTRYIYKLLQQGRKLPLKPLPLKVAYHTACHMDKSGWVPYSIFLLQQIPALQIIMLDAQCCGIAGTYGFKKENYTTAQSIGKHIFDQLEAGEFDYAVSDCETCKFQIDMSTSIECLHPITLLAMALDNKN